MVNEDQGPIKEMWRMNWNADPDLGATLVFRCVGIDPNAFTRDFDLYIYNGVVRERLVSNRGREIKLNKAGVAAEVNTAEWHIYRMIIIGDLIEVYVDEDPLASLSAVGEALDEAENNLFRFGDLGSATIGTFYDWFIWDVSGAYPPGAGTPIPEDLLETGSSDVDEKINSTQPYSFRLSQNFPNPFNPITEIPFQMTTQSHVQLKIYDLNGKLIHSLVDEIKMPGTYCVSWDGRDMYQNTTPSGVYLYSLETDSHKLLRKMILLK